MFNTIDLILQMTSSLLDTVFVLVPIGTVQEPARGHLIRSTLDRVAAAATRLLRGYFREFGW